PLETARLVQRLRDGVVLTWEAADQDVDRRQLLLPCLDSREDTSDVLVGMPLRSESLDICLRRELLPRRTWRLPLAAEGGDESLRRRFQPQPEAADAREQFCDQEGLGHSAHRGRDGGI